MEFVKKYLRLKKSLCRFQSIYIVDQIWLSFIMLPFSIVAILLPPHFSQNSPNGPKFMCFFTFSFFLCFLKSYTY